MRKEAVSASLPTPELTNLKNIASHAVSWSLYKCGGSAVYLSNYGIHGKLVCALYSPIL